jgi:PQQ-dependent catabolism-associated beta-propeller protein
MRSINPTRILILLASAVCATANTVFAHEGKPHQPRDLLFTWGLDPLVIASLLISAWLYFRGLRRMWHEAGRGRGIRRWEAAAFAAGWFALFVALVSPLHPLGEVLFSAHMTQHELLMLVAAPLIVLGRPVVAFLWSVPVVWSRRMGQWTKARWFQRGWKSITVPLAAWAIHALALWTWHVPFLFQATLRSDLVHTLQHVSFLGSALLFWWALIHGPQGALGYGVAALYVFTTSVHSGILGALITFAGTIIYPAYLHSTTSWGLTPLEDQQLGGLIMWVPAGLVYIVAGLALVAGWLRESDRRLGQTLMLLICVTWFSGCARAPSGPCAYVTNERDGTVTVIATNTDRVVSTINVGARPRGIRTSPDGKVVYVALSFSSQQTPGTINKIAAIDHATGKVVAQYDAGTDPEQFAVSTDGRRLFISNEDAGTASIVDTGSGKVVATVVVGIEPEGVTISPDGRWVYVTAETSNTVSVIDTQTNNVIATFMVGARPRDAAFSPDGARAYVTAELGRSISVIDTRTHSVIRTIDLPRGDGVKPMGVVVSHDGAKIYVANGRANSISVIDAATDTLVSTIPVGQRVWGLAITRDGKKLYAANGLSNDVSVIDTATDAVVATVKAGDGPWGIAIVGL